MPEYGILLDDGVIIVGPDWRGPDEVVHSFHAFGVARVYGRLVTRTPDTDWRAA